MKNSFQKITFATAFLSLAVVLTFFGCQDQQPVQPDLTVAKQSAGVTSEANFEAVVLEALGGVDEGHQLKIAKVKGGYDIVLSNEGGSAERTLACQGGGVGFIKCCKGQVDGGHPITISTCTPGPYCGYI